MAQSLTHEMISAAIEGFEAQKQRIDGQIGELRAMLSGDSTAAVATALELRRRKGQMSAAGRARIAEAQRQRWAAKKQTGSSASSSAAKQAAKPKRKLSAAGRKAISEATKRRWALQRAAAAKAK